MQRKKVCFNFQKLIKADFEFLVGLFLGGRNYQGCILSIRGGKLYFLFEIFRVYFWEGLINWRGRGLLTEFYGSSYYTNLTYKWLFTYIIQYIFTI